MKTKIDSEHAYSQNTIPIYIMVIAWRDSSVDLFIESSGAALRDEHWEWSGFSLGSSLRVHFKRILEVYCLITRILVFRNYVHTLKDGRQYFYKRKLVDLLKKSNECLRIDVYIRFEYSLFCFNCNQKEK